MRKTIVRTITTTTIESSIVKFENGKPLVDGNKPLIVNGIIDSDKALKEVRKAYGVNACVTNISQVDSTYEISVEDFIKYAKKVDKPTEESEVENGDKSDKPNS